MLSNTDLDAVVKQLVDARTQPQSAPTFAASASGINLDTLDDVYRIQEAVAKQIGAIGGWKVGADDAEATPVAAPVFAQDIITSPATITHERYRLRGIEAEIAFRLKADLPAGDQPYSEAEVIEAIENMVPLIELVDSRLTEGRDSAPFWKLADNQINAGFVIGQPIVEWQQLDTDNLRVVQRFNGEVAVDNTGYNYPDSPLGLLRRVANSCRHCGGLKAGQIVTTGSMTGIMFVDPGTEVSAEFAGVETLTVTV